MAACGINCIDLTTETIKTLGVHFSYNQKLETQKKFVKSITEYTECFQSMEKDKHYSGRENSNLQNISAI